MNTLGSDTTAQPRTSTPLGRIAAALAVIFATWAAIKLYKILVPPRNLRKYPKAGTWTLIRTLAKRMGYLEQHEVLFEAMRDNALERGIIKSRDETPPVYLTWFFGRWLVVVVNPDDMKLVLTKHDVFEKLPFDVGHTTKFIGQNVAVVQTPEWKRQRKVVNPAFRRGWATSLFGLPARQLIKHLDVVATQGAIMDPAGWMQRMTLDALSLAAFGTNVDSLNHPDAPIVETYNTLMVEILDISKLMNPFYKWSKDGRRALALIEAFDQFIFGLIDAKTANIAARKVEAQVADGGEDDEARDLLEMMVEAAEGTDFSREELRANTIVFFVAGHDTTANALTFAIYLLGMHQAVQDRARQEVIDVMGDMDRGTPADAMPFPTADQERRMTYLSCCIKEVMRLFPSLTIVPQRFTTTAVTLDDGTTLPRDTLVTGDIYSLHRAREVWGPDADVFKPDRFLDSVGHDGQIPMHPAAANFGWTPFGGGQRICLGQQFSLVEQRVVLAMLLLRYTWTVVGDENALKGKPASMPGNLLHAKGIQVRLERR
ncbi:hypothetical protein AMAG_14427 [Allomyces macrogynus ATCC 38327]|uniref:Cytochrome P450 n=1 Tax=Allomyces macrogynus (strain ATCC 38327) TaxID=578462 RepID=A0A0L0T6A1_ALLM3|nr:hypothetical protein AMAG_14427 [Allomyces macrogynus ATCC 38327]|eukprot:KNE70280.1 hypothetical protein AMAG_14427 [Allomyces macrogynus ATCC 38327]